MKCLDSIWTVYGCLSFSIIFGPQPLWNPKQLIQVTPVKYSVKSSAASSLSAEEEDPSSSAAAPVSRRPEKVPKKIVTSSIGLKMKRAGLLTKGTSTNQRSQPTWLEFQGKLFHLLLLQFKIGKYASRLRRPQHAQKKWFLFPRARLNPLATLCFGLTEGLLDGPPKWANKKLKWPAKFSQLPASQLIMIEK